MYKRIIVLAVVLASSVMLMPVISNASSVEPSATGISATLGAAQIRVTIGNRNRRDRNRRNMRNRRVVIRYHYVWRNGRRYRERY